MVSTSLDESATLTGLTPGTTYTVSVVATVLFDDGTVFTDSAAGTTQVTTEAGQLPPQLDTPNIQSVVSIDDNVAKDTPRGGLTITWASVDDAELYFVSVYIGNTEQARMRKFGGETSIETTELSHTFDNMTFGTLYTVNLVARANGYDDSAAATTEAWTSMFRVLPNANRVAVQWADTTGSGVTIDSLFYRFTEHTFEDFRFSINGIVSPVDVVTGEREYRSAPVLSPGTDYVLRVAIVPGDGVEAQDYDLRPSDRGPHLITGIDPNEAPLYRDESTSFNNSPFSELRFRTLDTALPQLATPMNVQATTTANSITATWDEVVSAIKYEVSLYAGSDTSGNQVGATQTIDVADARTASFTDLSPDTQYTVAVVALGDPATHSDSEPAIITETLPLPQLVTPQTTADLIKGGRVEFSWNAIAATDGASVSYGVRIVRVNDNMQIDRTTISATSHTFTGLDPATAYRIEVVAIAPNNRDSAAGVLEVETGTKKLPTPTGLEISYHASSSEITVSWDNVPVGVSTYAMTFVHADGTEEYADVDVTTAGSTTFTGLEAGTEYTLSVVSSGDSTKYRRSDVYQTTITTTADGQLERPVITALEVQGGLGIFVQWAAVAGATTYEVNLYEGTEATDTPAETANIREGNLLEVPFSPLLPNAEYTMGVRAGGSDTLADSEESVQSIAIPIYILEPIDSSLVQELSATTNSVTVGLDRGLIDVSHFLVELDPDPQNEGQVIVPELERYTFSDLTPDTEYEVSIVSSREEDMGHYQESTAHIERITTDALPQLSTPDVTATATASSITATWNEVANAIAYAVSLYIGSSVVPANQVGATQTITSLSHPFTGLSAETTYTVAVVAIGDPTMYADSAAGTTQVTTEEQQPLETPSILSVVSLDDNVAKEFSPRGGLEITWTPVANASTYVVSVYVGNTEVAETQQVEARSIETTELSFMFDDLRFAALYTVNLVAGGAEGYRDSAAATTEAWTSMFRVLPDANKVIVQWTDTDAGTERDDHLSLRIDTSEPGIFGAFRFSISTIDSSSIVPPTDVDSYDQEYRSDSMLSPGTNYVLRVAVIPFGSEDAQDYPLYFDIHGLPYNAITDSLYEEANKPFSNSPFSEIRFRTRDTALPQLSTPTVTATATANSITATWNEVADAVEYKASLYEGSDTSGSQVGTTQTISVANERTASFTGLTQGTEYTVAVVAIADPATHNDSDAGTVTITADDDTPPPPPLPQLSTPGVTVTATTNNITATWGIVIDAVNYEVSLYEGDNIFGNQVGATQTITGLSHMFTGLTPVTEYTVAVVAIANPATHRNSDPGTATITTKARQLPPPPPPPQPPQGISYENVTATSVALKWTAACFTTPSPSDCTSSDLRYRLRITDNPINSDDDENMYQSTLEQEVMTPQIQQIASDG